MSTQAFLTLSLEATIAASVLHFTAAFAAYCWSRVSPAPVAAAYSEIPDVLIDMDDLLSGQPSLEELQQPTATDEALADLVEPLYSNMTSAELRKECSDRGIAWRNVYGSGKHLRKAEMLELLTAY